MRKDKAKSISFIQGIQSPIIARKMVLPLDHSIYIKSILQVFQICLALSWTAEVFPHFGSENNCLITNLFSLNLFLCNSVTTMYISKV